MIAVIEAIIANCCDLFNWTRTKSSWINCVVLTLLATPIILGFNVWKDIKPFGEGSDILSLADFILSNNLLPIGSIIMLIFCTTRYGWGWDKCIAEINQGDGIKLKGGRYMHIYFKYVLPVMILGIFLMGYYQLFFK